MDWCEYYYCKKMQSSHYIKLLLLLAVSQSDTSQLGIKHQLWKSIFMKGASRGDILFLIKIFIKTSEFLPGLCWTFLQRTRGFSINLEYEILKFGPQMLDGLNVYRLFREYLTLLPISKGNFIILTNFFLKGYMESVLETLKF